MNNEERLNLQKMINANDVEDQTEKIRKSKHSIQIRDEVKNLVELKKKYLRLSKTNPHEFDRICISRCKFLFNNYTDIFNKVKKDEIDLSILNRFLVVLKKIEDGEVDQHEGSFEVGKLLKELYIDSALKKSDKLDKNRKNEKNEKKEEKKVKAKNISWSEYKEINNISLSN